MSASQMASIATALRTLLNNGGYSGVKIIGYDHNWGACAQSLCLHKPEGLTAISRWQMTPAIQSPWYVQRCIRVLRSTNARYR